MSWCARHTLVGCTRTLYLDLLEKRLEEAIQLALVLVQEIQGVGRQQVEQNHAVGPRIFASRGAQACSHTQIDQAQVAVHLTQVAQRPVRAQAPLLAQVLPEQVGAEHPVQRFVAAAERQVTPGHGLELPCVRTTRGRPKHAKQRTESTLQRGPLTNIPPPP